MIDIFSAFLSFQWFTFWAIFEGKKTAFLKKVNPVEDAFTSKSLKQLNIKILRGL